MKTSSLIFGSIALFLLLSSCSSPSHSYQEPTILFETKKNVSGEDLSLEGIQLSSPVNMMVFDSLLFIHDRFEKNEEEYFFLFGNRFTGKVVRVFGREGRGPDEFLFPTYISNIPGHADKIGVYNRNQFSFSELGVNEILSDSLVYTALRVDELPVGYSVVARIDQNRLIGTGFFNEGRYAVSNNHGEIVYVGGEYPFENEFKNINKQAMGMAFQSEIGVHPELPLIASVTFASANLDILKWEEDSLFAINTINSYPPIFENESTSTRLSARMLPENRAGYQDVAVTTSFIYALYSGVTMKESWEKYTSGRRVLVFDWDGNPMVQLDLDRDVVNICVDANDKILYAVATDENGHASIARFNLEF